MPDPTSDSEQSLFARATNFFRPEWRSNSVLPTLRAFSGDLVPPETSNDEKGGSQGHSDTGTNGSPGPEVVFDGTAEAPEGDRHGHRYARAIPPGMEADVEDEPETDDADVESQLLPQYPQATRAPHHLFIPTPKPGHDPGKGKKMDAGRSRAPVTIRQPLSVTAERWQSFGRNGHAPRMPEEQGELVDDQWERERLADLEKPWQPQAIDQAEKEPDGFWIFSDSRRTATKKRIRHKLMNNPFVVLVMRVMVLFLVFCALGLGADIFRRTKGLNANQSERSQIVTNPKTQGDAICQQQPSTYLAFIVDSFALIYLVYIVLDEYFSKPLGLRRTRDKLRLLFLDIIFIVFSSANLGLAFDTVLDRQWACNSAQSNNNQNQQAAQSTCVHNAELCRRQQGLCGVLVIVLVVWLQTFAVSVFRVVERISH